MNKLECFRGDSKTLKFNFTDGNNAEINITDWIVYFTVKKNTDDADNDAVIHKQVSTHYDALHGHTVVVLTPADTNELTGTYHYDIQFKKPDGTVKTLVKDKIEFLYDITRAGSV